MSLYYQDDYVTPSHGDSLTDMREWLNADVLVTDPPYGIDWTARHGRAQHGTKDQRSTKSAIYADGDTAARDAALDFWGNLPAIYFGSWRIPRPSTDLAIINWSSVGA